MVWCEILRCGMYNTLPSASRTSSLHHSTSDSIPNHTTFRVTPSFLTRSHISYRTIASRSTLPLRNTIFQISPYRPRYASRTAPHFIICTTFRVLHVAFRITPYIGHIMQHTTTSRIKQFTQVTLHCILPAPHLA